MARINISSLKKGSDANSLLRKFNEAELKRKRYQELLLRQDLTEPERYEYKKLRDKYFDLSRKSLEARNELLKSHRNYLETRFLLPLFIFSFLASLLFLSPNITGNAIGSLSYADSGFLGILFFVCSLVCVFLYCRKKLKVVSV